MAFDPSIDLTGIFTLEYSQGSYVATGEAVFSPKTIDLTGVFDLNYSQGSYVATGEAVFSPKTIDLTETFNYEFSTRNYAVEGVKIFGTVGVESYITALPVVAGDTGQVIVFGYIVDFVGSPRVIYKRRTVSFVPTVLGPRNLTYYWDFGDGGTSTDPLPTHRYDTPGIYTVTLRVEDVHGKQGVRIRPRYIQVLDRVFNLNFSGVPVRGAANLKVRFTHELVEQ